VNGRAILYADQVTGSMRRALDEMTRRRDIQRAYNAKHDITPQSIVKSLEEVRLSTRVADARSERPQRDESRTGKREKILDAHDPAQRAELMQQIERRMREAAANLEFEEAALLRDQLNELRAVQAPDVQRGGTATAARPRRRR
jgi:excinuclease ABC subunit B